MSERTVRRDRLGRRIGRNWWREYVHDLWFNANAAWERAAEEATSLYDTEMREFLETNPRPKFKDSLIANKGMSKMLTAA